MPIAIEILKTGRVLHGVSDELAICMIEIGAAKQWTPPPKPQPTPEWRIHTSDYDRCVIGLVLKTPREDIIVSGSAEGMLQRCEAALAGRKLPLPSPELIAHYARVAEVK